MTSLAIILAALAAGAPNGIASPVLDDYIRQTFHLSRYKLVEADLNGDRRPEAIIYANDPSYCGTGGCSLFVLTPARNGYRVVLHASVSRPPVWLLATRTRGWRDLGVTVSGGGVTKPYVARLRFNGRNYPGNPSIAPAARLAHPSGRIILAH